MTDVNVTSDVVVQQMTKQEAEAWEQEIGKSVNGLRLLLADGYERQAWRALGYPNWTDCVQALSDKYGFSERHAWRLHAANETEKLLTNWSVGSIPESHLRPLVSLPPEQQVQIWQQVVDTAPAGKITAAFVQETVERVTRPENIHVSDDSYEWYTPYPYIQAARAVMGGIDLDPASCKEANGIVEASEYFTQDDNGMTREWYGRVWLNPPYNMPNVENFTARAHVLYQNGKIEQACVLVNNATDAGWFHALMENYPVCFTRGRVKYWGPHASQARQGQAIFYLGKNCEAFVREFSLFGVVVSKYDGKQ